MSLVVAAWLAQSAGKRPELRADPLVTFPFTGPSRGLRRHRWAGAQDRGVRGAGAGAYRGVV